MNLLQFLLIPIYLFLPIILVIYYSTFYIKEVNDKFFFFWGFLLKIFGASVAILIYIYYYGGGDTVSFQNTGCKLADYVRDYPLNFIEVLSMETISQYNNYDFMPYLSGMEFRNDPFTTTILKISMLFNLITFNSFFLTSVLCSYFSFFASWMFYKMIIGNIRYFKKQVGFAIFFMPSVVFWGSGLFKDTFTLAGLFLLIIGLINILAYRSFSLSNFVFAFIGIILLVNIRSFFILAALPFIALWIFLTNTSRITNVTLRLLISTTFIFIIGFFMIFILQYLTSTLKELSLENLEDRAKGFQSWHTTLKASAYSLGDLDYSSSGIIAKIPAAINVTFFRPYIWEVSKPIIFMSFLQSFSFLLITIYILWKTKIIYFFKHIFRSGEGAALMGFSLFYAFIVGFTSYNFGALDRYKIPCLTTYIIALIFVYESYKLSKKKST